MKYIVSLVCVIFVVFSLGHFIGRTVAESREHPQGKDIGLYMPQDCAADRIISVSNGKTGLVLAYRGPNGGVKAALYPNPQAGSGPEFTFVFLNNK